MRGKKGKSKFFTLFGAGIVALLAICFIMTAAGDDSLSEEAQTAIAEKTGASSLPEGVENYVENFAEKQGVSPDEINSITEVDFNELPKEVSIENVDDTNLAIYQIDYNKSSSNKKLFVIAYAVEKLASQGDLIISQDKREFLNFGFSGEMSESGFLKTAAGVEGSLEKGYVMLREGSITGISTNMEILKGTGEIEIVIYRNGMPIQFGNTFAVESEGVKKDYDVQSKGTVVFNAGDVISLYVKASDGINWKDVTSLVEITS